MKILFLLALVCLAKADFLSLIETNVEPDPNASPCQLTEADTAQLDPTVKHILVRGLTADNKFVQDATHYLSRMDYRVCIVTGAQPNSEPVTFVWNGRKTVYYGKRDVHSLIRFVQQVESRLTLLPYETIASKMDKKAFDHVFVPKVVGYFPDPNSVGFSAFVEAASQLSPTIPCYVVHDQALAAKLRLNQIGQVALVRRLEKSTIYFQPSTSMAPTTDAATWTANDIVTWVNSNRGLVLHDLDDTNLYDPEIHNPNQYQLVSIGNRNSPLGLYFFKMLNKAIQNISRENDLKLTQTVPDPSAASDPAATAEVLLTPPQLIRLDDIKVIWIDLTKYPAARSKIEKLLVNQVPISNKDVWFGLIQTPAAGLEQTPIWFDMSTLNLTASDRSVDEANIQLLRNWILQVTNRAQQSQASSGTQQPQAFSMEPEPVNPRHGSSFVLNCKIANKVGECSWALNNQPLKVDGVQYQWSGLASEGDCSIMIKSADKMRDTGLWSCHVSSGATGSNALTSRLVAVHVHDTPKEEL